MGLFGKKKESSPLDHTIVWSTTTGQGAQTVVEAQCRCGQRFGPGPWAPTESAINQHTGRR